MQSTFKKLSSYISKYFTRSGIVHSTKPEQVVSSRFDISRTCQRLTMDKFLDCLVDQKYDVLSNAPNVGRAELEEAWVEILAEYHEMRGDINGGMEEFYLSRDVRVLHNHLFLVQTCVDFLAERYTQKVADCLRQLGYSFRPKSKWPEEYMPLLVSVVNRAKSKYIELQQMIKALNQKMSEIDPEAKLSKQPFYDALLNYEITFKVSYDMDTVTVAKFISLEKKYNELIERERMKKAL